MNSFDTNNQKTNIQNGQPKFCKNCGHKIAPGGKFCPECGKQINTTEQNPQAVTENAAYSQKRTTGKKQKGLLKAFFAGASIILIICVVIFIKFRGTTNNIENSPRNIIDGASKEKYEDFKSENDETEKSEPEEEAYEIDDDSYETFETLLQNLAEGLNDGDVIRMRESFIDGNVPGEFLAISGNYIFKFELIDISLMLEGDEIEQTLIERNLVEEEYEEYARQSTKACVLKVAIEQTTISDNSVERNNDAMVVAIKTDGKWSIVPWI